MPKKKSPEPRKKKPVPISRTQRVKQWVASLRSDYLSRRPHRSFRLTRRRDYARSLNLPGYWSFTAYVWRVLSPHKKLFAGLVLFYGLTGAAFVGVASQDIYSQLSQLLDTTSSEVFEGSWGAIGQAGLLLLSGMSGGLSTELTDVQRVYAGIILLLTWLSTVWLLRGILAGTAPRLRDGLYNSGGPIVATGLVLLTVIIQLIPATLGIMAFNAAVGTELFDSGIMAMLVSVSVGLLVLLSLYWVTSSFFAMIIVTLPGMYPLQAIRTAGDLVIGRRTRILLRLVWLMVGNLIFWILTVLIAILVDRLITNVLPIMSKVPFVPIVIMVITSIMVVWSAAYVYLLYRKVVDDDAKPA